MTREIKHLQRFLVFIFKNKLKYSSITPLANNNWENDKDLLTIKSYSTNTEQGILLEENILILVKVNVFSSTSQKSYRIVLRNTVIYINTKFESEKLELHF